MKIDDNTIEIEQVTDSVVTRVQLERGFLERQREGIQAQRDTYCAARDRELAEVDAYLAECDRLGIVARELPDGP